MRAAARRAWGAAGVALGTCALVYWLAAGRAAGYGVSALWVWAAAGAVLLAVGAADLVIASRPVRAAAAVTAALRAAILLAAAVFLTVECFVARGMNARCETDADVLLIAGAMVYGETPSSALTARLDCAADYLRAHPSARAVLCGGQGPGEAISEAEAMRRYLTAAGIGEARLLLEDRSATTAENMRFAYALLDDPSARVCVVTSNFHVCRTRLLAAACGWKDVEAIAAPFSGVMLPHYMAREFLTLLVDHWRGNW